MYQIIDRITNAYIGNPVKSLFAAMRKVDKLDTKYGACRYSWIRI